MFSLDAISGGSNKISERYYQVEAVQAIVAGLADGGRGQLRSACGTGKTVMAQCSAVMLCPPGGVVVVVAPSIYLVGQTLREWARSDVEHRGLAVCSDGTVLDGKTPPATGKEADIQGTGEIIGEGVGDGVETDALMIEVGELDAPVTTCPEDVAAWLAEPLTTGLRLIVGTHLSANVIGDGLRRANIVADVLVIDEAHRTAGEAAKHTALVHDDFRLPARRRLYCTATPRVVGHTERGRGRRRSFSKRTIGMDDEEIFGPVLYRYPFSQAIADGYLDDYRLVVMGVTRQEVRRYLAELPRDATAAGFPTSLHTAMVQTVLAKAAQKYSLRRVLTFCRRLNEAADFARTMPATLGRLPADMRPDRPLTAAHVHGGMTHAERDQRLGLLVQPPRDGWTVVTNVRCLGEGVDVPAIDSVAFTHPKQSINEIIQAIGRALRRDPGGSGVATILVPILLPDDPEELEDTDVADYRLLWQVVRALRAHDDVFGVAIDRLDLQRSERYQYEAQPLEHVLIDLPPDYDDGRFLHHITARIITSARHTWWDGYAELRRFHAEHGHTTFPRDHVVTTDGGDTFRLGAWAHRTRVAYRHGTLTDGQVEALDELRFDLAFDAVEWANGLHAATAFRAEHGHLEPVRAARINGVDLHTWLAKQRDLAADNDLPAERKAALDALDMRWHLRPVSFAEHVEALTRYHQRHGHIDIAPDPGSEEGYLGSWLVSVRIKHKRRLLTAEEIAALDALGMRWQRRPTPASAPATTPASTPPSTPPSTVLSTVLSTVPSTRAAKMAAATTTASHVDSRVDPAGDAAGDSAGDAAVEFVPPSDTADVARPPTGVQPRQASPTSAGAPDPERCSSQMSSRTTALGNLEPQHVDGVGRPTPTRPRLDSTRAPQLARGRSSTSHRTGSPADRLPPPAPMPPVFQAPPEH
jgi:superfamily II DNA or RNA helicase